MEQFVHNPLNPTNPLGEAKPDAVAARKAMERKREQIHLTRLLENEDFQWFWREKMGAQLGAALTNSLDESHSNEDRGKWLRVYKVLDAFKNWPVVELAALQKELGA